MSSFKVNQRCDRSSNSWRQSTYALSQRLRLAMECMSEVISELNDNESELNCEAIRLVGIPDWLRNNRCLDIRWPAMADYRLALAVLALSVATQS